MLASTSQIPDPSKLTLKTAVNGEQRQPTKTDDLMFDVPAIVRHLTRGRTVYPGTVVMTGTPSGVAAFMKPKAWLKDGDIVEVEISSIGKSKKRWISCRWILRSLGHSIGRPTMCNQLDICHVESKNRHIIGNTALELKFISKPTGALSRPISLVRQLFRLGYSFWLNP